MERVAALLLRLLVVLLAVNEEGEDGAEDEGGQGLGLDGQLLQRLSPVLDFQIEEGRQLCKFRSAKKPSAKKTKERKCFVRQRSPPPGTRKSGDPCRRADAGGRPRWRGLSVKGKTEKIPGDNRTHTGRDGHGSGPPRRW